VPIWPLTQTWSTEAFQVAPLRGRTAVAVDPRLVLRRYSDGFSLRFASRMAYYPGMPRPEFGPEDYENPNAPEDEQRIRADHPAVRDLSYDKGRSRQYLDLWKQSLVETSLDPWEGTDPLKDDAKPGPSLELFIKERPRGRGYVCDFVYREPGLPIAVYGTLVNEGHGLMVNEVELWRGGVTGAWEYRDAWGDYIGPDANRDDSGDTRPYPGITSSLLRRIPLGRIVAAAQRTLAERNWVTEGIRVVPGGLLVGDDIPGETRTLLERTNEQASPQRRGRPPLADDLLEQVARAYLEEAPAGTGLTHRLAERFGRPEPTVRDWVAAARERGYLSPARPSRRGAAPGPRLKSRDGGDDDGVR
jgi:hypothetical protein